MAKKRFTDIEIWDKEWFMDLTPKLKCLMKYLHDKCDASGCWKPNWKLASLHINEEVNQFDLSLLPKDQFEILENGKIFISDFVNFQYGKISKNSPAHNPVFIAIEKNGLNNRVFNRVLDTLQEKDIEKDIDKEEYKVVEKKYICPEMQKVFKKRVMNYSPDNTRDFEPLLSIANFIHKQENMNGDIAKNHEKVLEVWDLVSNWISVDKFYSQKSLKTISTHIQEIFNKTNNKEIQKPITNRPKLGEIYL